MWKRQAGFTLIELLIVVAIIGVVAAIAIPGLLRARMSGNESSAIGSLRAINSAQATYATAAAQGGYAVLLATLAQPCPGGNAGFISSDLSTDPAVKSGYTLTLAAGATAVAGPDDCNGTASSLGYYATAVPIAPGISGSRAFATDAGSAIWQNTAAAGAAAPPQPFVMGGTTTPIQ